MVSPAQVSKIRTVQEHRLSLPSMYLLSPPQPACCATPEPARSKQKEIPFLQIHWELPPEKKQGRVCYFPNHTTGSGQSSFPGAVYQISYHWAECGGWWEAVLWSLSPSQPPALPFQSQSQAHPAEDTTVGRGESELGIQTPAWRALCWHTHHTPGLHCG